ncbi:hydroxypyruvate reductase [Clostridium pasteurianum DSM 525 = ATCC 6013]|uniref:2-oxoglutarate reductase n=1 Tax=Clostridium pasteurianum DSM 525 = ATCC 6013 TaxID=1262449 RepID=A0A0H3J2L8_CLOPA|nr:D-2-hydroxyacid dehydrogenase [Clostridium pasteurianum]AJA46153.1 hydroxypyruvate reductase [Clostridium pasteurianum DSM 525 = ATCC 6013]AJA50141.1 hydroxypyruvate reductase [Clostridium pasteurianum DSM 525 = ATCC 6013]AOZ73614.1 3-phosphoglycerate dehydrogenase [Clostridium pasteurianum DSM 525 = ATCC 6013]AOZ77411.1 3-phosphoglycerate dehydrogenase [Clostridium pasteurianum]ELP57736.1 D-3-phosphoglycerate dehydrogenase [Clostridium pasteurianum DSM 525 = ATCC 6013]
MLRILANDGMEKKTIEILEKKGFEVLSGHLDGDDLLKEVKNIDCLIVRSATKVRKDLIDIAASTGRLKLIIRGGVGIDNIDAAYAIEKGIQVNNTPNASSISVAEMTFGHMLSVSRKIYLSNVTMREGKWEKKKYQGTELYGRTLGLIGFGRIAREVAKRAVAFGMKVMYYDICTAENTGECICATKDGILRESDFISLHIPYKKGEPYVIGEKEFQIIKKGAYIINCARGGVIDENALVKALDEGKIAGAALDVFEKEPPANELIIKNPKISLTPHIGAATVEAQERIGDEIVNIIDKFFNNKN